MLYSEDGCIFNCSTVGSHTSVTVNHRDRAVSASPLAPLLHPRCSPAPKLRGFQVCFSQLLTSYEKCGFVPLPSRVTFSFNTHLTAAYRSLLGARGLSKQADNHLLSRGFLRKSSPLKPFLLPAGSDYFIFSLCCSINKRATPAPREPEIKYKVLSSAEAIRWDRHRA